MPEPLIPAEWANGLMEMIRNSDWNSWSAHDRKVEIIQVFLFKFLRVGKPSWATCSTF